MKIDELSVFFPVYNEEKNIPVTVEKAIAVLKTLGLKKYEIILVDDGSKDKSPEIIDNLAKKYNFIKAIHQANGGYGCALRTGLANASYDWIVYTDADGQFDFSEVTKFLEKAEEADVIYAYKIKRSDPPFRMFAAAGWAFSLFLVLGLRVKDVDTGFKMVNKKVLQKIAPLESTRGGMINAELVMKARKAGFRFAQVSVNHYHRLYGKPSGVKLEVIIQSYLDLLKLWWKLH
ncbi:MAG: glycosyltransferase family 2 protein [Candidatus Daviesbacteria bacterium]|nr:glycosyltransferase family 2 protein [Candidatus Daviesbacteria bacterium]